MADEKKSVIIDLKFNVSDYTTNAAKLNKEIADLNKQQAALKKANQEGSIEFQRNAEILKENRRELAENNKVIQNLTIANKANAGSNEQMKAQLSLLTLEYNKMSVAEQQTSVRGKELNGQINQLTTDLKKSEEGVQNHSRSFGEYEKGINSATGGMLGMIKASVAFMMTPIGAVLTLIVGAFAALKKALTSSEEGQNKVNKVMEVFGTIIQKVFDALAPLANFIMDTVVKAFEYFGNEVEKTIKGVAATLKFLGLDQAAADLDNFVNSTSKAAKAAALIADARVKAEEIERGLIVDKAKLEAQIADAKLKSRDTDNLTAKERKAALEEAKKGILELGQREEYLAELKFKAAKAELAQTQSSAEAKKAVAVAEAELFNVQRGISENLKGLRKDGARVDKEIDAANKERQDKLKEQLAERIENSKKEIDLFILQQGFKKKTLVDELILAEEVSKKKIAILVDELKNKLVSQTEYDLQLLTIQQELLKKQAILTADNANRELQTIVENNQSKIDANQFLNDEMYKQEVARLELVAQANRAYQQQLFENGTISQTQLNDAINKINNENAENLKALAEEKKIADDEQKAVDLANQRDIDILNNENIFLEQEKDLERSRQLELQEAEKTGADKKLIDEKYKKFKEDLEAKQAVTTLGVAADTFGALSSLMGDNAEAAKVFAIAQATMNAFQSITAVLSAVSTIPEPAGSIAKGIQAAAIGVTAFRNVQGIANTPVPKKKAAKGGIFGGESHDNGGTKGWFSDGTQIEVEQGELFAVVNKTNTAMLSQLSALNSFGGNGVSFGSQKSYLADGGIAFTSSSTAVENQNSSVEQIVNALQSMPTPVVAVQDINEIQTQTNRIEVRAML